MTDGRRPTPEFLALQAAVSGRYSIERELGRGGMGVVYLARDVALERPVALKMLLPHLAHDAALRERFLREARTAAQLMHPNIVPIHAVEAHEELVFFVMAFVDGETLAERVGRTGPASPDEAMRVMRDVAWALAYAHSCGVVHRDIKPDNILLERQSGRALVADFGIAHVAQRQTLSEAGAFVGTVQYMSPEQASAEQVDGRSDVYSLAATIFFALTGESPVQAATLPAMLARLMSEPSPNVSLVRPETPPGFAEVISRGLVRDRATRLESAELLARDLQRLERTAPAVRPEIRRYLLSLDLLGFLSGLGISVPLMGLAMFGRSQISNLVFDLLVLIAVGFAAIYALIAPVGLLGLRAQGLSWREVVDGLEAAGIEAANVNWRLWRRSFGDTATKVRRRLVIGGFFASAVYVGGAFAMFHFVESSKGALSSTFPLLMGVAGVAMGGWAIHNGFRSQTDFELWLATPRKPSWRMRTLSWLARRSWVQRFFARATPDASASVRVAPTATLLLERVEDLVKELPPALLARLGDPVEVARHLESACGRLRARGAKLDAALAEVPVESPARQDFVNARQRISDRIANCTAALEQMRTDLLRLNAGLIQADGVTLDLERAMELGAAVDAELHGHDEVRKLLS